MKKLLLLTTAMCWLISYSLQAEAPGYAGDPQGVSPQTATIIRFDNTPVNMNAGRIDLNIPLYSQ